MKENEEKTHGIFDIIFLFGMFFYENWMVQLSLNIIFEKIFAIDFNLSYWQTLALSVCFALMRLDPLKRGYREVQYSIVIFPFLLYIIIWACLR
jgi:hypothetical protein